MAAYPVPCPVRLGVVRNDGLYAELHIYTVEKNLAKMEKLLKKGVDVDCVNDLGQTPLFCAALLGLTSVTKLLLQYGADPNHRCEDMSTPVHAAVFSCKPWLLSGLLDAGGDLRLHDQEGRRPPYWATCGAQEHSARMVEFLKNCAAHMQRLLQSSGSRELCRHSSSSSSKTWLQSPSFLEFIKSGGSDLKLNRRMNSKSSACDKMQCFGFGKLFIGSGLVASIPVIRDSDLTHADDEPLLSFSCGPLTTMTNYSWKGSRVTVKELSLSSSQRSSHTAHMDLLLIEQDYCSQLSHPHLLQLMTASVSADLTRTRLVFERVHVSSLHNLLHQRRAEFPALQAEWLLSVVLQVCEGLLYLHSRDLVMRALSSHSVVLTFPRVAKLTGLGFMVPSEGTCANPPVHLALPPGLYNWAAPEVIKRRPCTGKADLYSLCALIQELYTDMVPWGPVDPQWIKKHMVDGGQALTPDSRVPQPYYTLVSVGLQPHAQDRTHSLQNLCYTLRCDIECLSQEAGRRGGVYVEHGVGLRPAGWSSQFAAVNEPLDTALPPATFRPITDEEALSGNAADTTVDREIHTHLNELDKLLDRETETEEEGERDKRQVGEEDSESSFRRDISFRDILPLDDWRLSPASSSAWRESESDEWSAVGRESESDEWSAVGRESESDEWTTVNKDRQVELMRKIVALQASHSKNVSEKIGSIVLNLKIAQVLHEECNSSLNRVEICLERRQLDMGRVDDEVDVSSYSRAVGPPSSEYHLLPHGLYPQAKRLEAELLKGENIPMSQEDLAVWLKEYPPERYPTLEHCPVERPAPPSPGSFAWNLLNHTPSERALGRSDTLAQDDSFVNTLPRNSQQTARGRETERPEQSQPFSEQQSEADDTDELTDRPSVSSEESDSLEEDSPTPQPRGLQWRNAVSELVAKMTRGRLGPVAGSSGSSNSEEMEDRQAKGPPRDKQDPKPPSSLFQTPQPQRREEESGTELEKSFTDFESQSSFDADFHTVTQTVGMTDDVFHRERTGEVEGDISQSPVGPPSIFYTPTAEQRNSQTPSLDEELDVTMEVCRPVASGSAPEGDTQDTNHRECKSLQNDYEEMDTNPVISGAHVPFPHPRGLPALDDLAELSSITCSPSQLHGSLHPSRLGRPPPPCNSTPHSPAPHHRAMGDIAKPVPPLASLLDSSSGLHSSSVHPNTGSFTTAIDMSTDSSTTGSASSALQSPSEAESCQERTDSPQDFTTASSGQMGALSTCTAPLPATTEEEKGPVMEEERGGREDEMEEKLGRQQRELRREPEEEKETEDEEYEGLEQADHTQEDMDDLPSEVEKREGYEGEEREDDEQPEDEASVNDGAELAVCPRGQMDALASLLDFSSGLHSSSVHPNTGSFTTAIDMSTDSSTTGSASSALQSPSEAESCQERTDSPQDFTTASSGQMGALSTCTAPLPATTEEEKGPVMEEERGGREDEMEEKLGRQQRELRREPEEEKETEDEELEERNEGDEEGDSVEEGEYFYLASEVEKREGYEGEEREDDEQPEDEASVNDGAELAVCPRGQMDDDLDPEGPGSMEESNRAHSTLDDVLQGMLVEGAPGHRVPRSTGPGMTKPQWSVFEAQGESEVIEDAERPWGDHAEWDERKHGPSALATRPNMNDQTTRETGDRKA